jgi:hypothetical protein
MHDPSEKVTAIRRLKQEIERLTVMQSDALKAATYLGMTPDRLRDCGQRRRNIGKLIQELALLEKENEKRISEQDI